MTEEELKALKNARASAQPETQAERMARRMRERARNAELAAPTLPRGFNPQGKAEIPPLPGKTMSPITRPATRTLPPLPGKELPTPVVSPVDNLKDRVASGNARSAALREKFPINAEVPPNVIPSIPKKPMTVPAGLTPPPPVPAARPLPPPTSAGIQKFNPSEYNLSKPPVTAPESAAERVAGKAVGRFGRGANLLATMAPAMESSQVGLDPQEQARKDAEIAKREADYRRLTDGMNLQQRYENDVPLVGGVPILEGVFSDPEMAKKKRQEDLIAKLTAKKMKGGKSE